MFESVTSVVTGRSDREGMAGGSHSPQSGSAAAPVVRDLQYVRSEVGVSNCFELLDLVLAMGVAGKQQPSRVIAELHEQRRIWPVARPGKEVRHNVWGQLHFAVSITQRHFFDCRAKIVDGSVVAVQPPAVGVPPVDASIDRDDRSQDRRSARKDWVESSDMIDVGMRRHACFQGEATGFEMLDKARSNPKTARPLTTRPRVRSAPLRVRRRRAAFRRSAASRAWRSSRRAFLAATFSGSFAFFGLRCRLFAKTRSGLSYSERTSTRIRSRRTWGPLRVSGRRVSAACHVSRSL